jgi:hypothetical protein
MKVVRLKVGREEEKMHNLSQGNLILIGSIAWSDGASS